MHIFPFMEVDEQWELCSVYMYQYKCYVKPTTHLTFQKLSGTPVIHTVPELNLKFAQAVLNTSS